MKNLTALQRELKYLGFWKFAEAVMCVQHKVLGLPEEKMIAPMAEMRVITTLVLKELLRIIKSKNG